MSSLLDTIPLDELYDSLLALLSGGKPFCPCVECGRPKINSCKRCLECYEIFTARRKHCAQVQPTCLDCGIEISSTNGKRLRCPSCALPYQKQWTAKYMDKYNFMKREKRKAAKAGDEYGLRQFIEH